MRLRLISLRICRSSRDHSARLSMREIVGRMSAAEVMACSWATHNQQPTGNRRHIISCAIFEYPSIVGMVCGFQAGTGAALPVGRSSTCPIDQYREHSCA